MKGLKAIFGAFAAASLLFSVNAFAQENANRDENGKVVRGPYETNGVWDNLFVGGGVGINYGAAPSILLGEKNIGMGADLYVGKWWTPVIGGRVGWHGLNHSKVRSGASVGLAENTAYGDLLWSATNSIWGYKQTRLLDVNVYAGIGYSWIQFDTSAGFDHEVVGHTGVLLDLYLNRHLSLTLDLGTNIARAVNYNYAHASTSKVGKFLDIFYFPAHVELGVNYAFGHAGFQRHSSVTPVIIPVPFTTEQYNDLSDRVAELEKENAELKDKIAALENEVAPLRQLVNGQTYLFENGTFTAIDTKAGAPLTLYFDCDSSTLSNREKAHLEYFLDNVLGENTKFTVHGYADKYTGTARYNQGLSERRVKTVVKLLTKAGAKEENIETAAHGSSIQLFKGAPKNRVVTIEVVR